MKSLTIGTTYELRDRFSLFEDYPDIKIFETITNNMSGGWLADRTSIVQLPFRTEIIQKHVMPDFSTIESLSLEECCSKKAHELLSDNSPIYLLYSGGIDSTLALVSLIKAGIRKDQLTVVCNTDSIRENPTFFYTHIKSKFKLMSSELFMQHARTSPLPGRAVLCEPGDALYGQYLGATAFTTRP